jgi:hypothetical protein
VMANSRPLDSMPRASHAANVRFADQATRTSQNGPGCQPAGLEFWASWTRPNFTRSAPTWGPGPASCRWC